MIYKRTIQYHVTRHCTLRCAHCATQSQAGKQKPWSVDIEVFKRDLIQISKVFNLHELLIIGGEPLLHPQIDELVKFAKQINVAKAITVHTNGQLLEKQSDTFYQYVDNINISVYPNVNINYNKIASFIENINTKYMVSLNMSDRSRFNIMEAAPDANRDTQHIFDTCECSITSDNPIVWDGRYYKCAGAVIANTLDADGCDLNEEDVIEHLADKKHMKACLTCLGSSGPSFIGYQEKPIKIIRTRK